MRRLSCLIILAFAISAAPAVTQTAPSAQPAAPEASKPQVLFERSTEKSHEPANLGEPALAGKGASGTIAITDAMRTAPVFTSYDLEVHLAPAQASLAVEARLSLRNGGTEPLAAIPVQLSSTLHIERVSLGGGARLGLTQKQVASDADHSGELEETLVQLAQPLPPGASLTLAVAYSGTIQPGAARLDQFQTPAEVAESSDWDRISEEFTGLRGFGDVVWYPVCSVPALLGDGAKLFAEIGRQRAQNQDATIAIRVTDEFTGAAPSVAILAGHSVRVGLPQAMPSASFPGVLRLEQAPTRLGFRAPSLFLADRMRNVPEPVATGIGVRAGLLAVYSTPADAADADHYQAAAGLVEPLLTEWLGSRMRPQLALIDLPVAGAQPSEQGDAVLVSLIDAEPAQIAPLLVRELTHSFFHSPRVWLDEGIPALMGNLYAEQSQGRPAALVQMAAARGALALVEPASPGTDNGRNLLEASDPIYYRAKALYVLTMLRDLAGDKGFGAALRAYDAAADTQPEYFERLVERASGKDLKWFFDAWVYRDLGLPDLSIANVYSSRTGQGQGQTQTQADQWLVSVDIANDGYAEVEVPVTVHSASTAVAERVRIAGRTKVSRRLLIVGQPTSVEVNDGTVPEVQASVHQRLLQ